MNGYFSEFNKRGSNCNYDDDIIFMLSDSILLECVELIKNGYNLYIIDEEKNFAIDEPTITAGIYGHIEKIIHSNSLPFTIVPEYFDLTEEMKKGFVKLNVLIF